MDRPFDVVLDTLIRINPDYGAALTRHCSGKPNVSKRFFRDGTIYPLGNISECKKFANKGFIIVCDAIYICKKEDDGWYQTGEGIMI